MTIEPEALVGQSLLEVTSSWHEHHGKRSPDPVHLWLSVSQLGTLRLHTAGDGSLEIAVAQPYDPYDMKESGRVTVERIAPESLRKWLGQRIGAVSTPRQDPPGMKVGLVLYFHHGSVGLANLGDEFVIHAWPATTWEHWDVAVDSPV